MARSSLWKTQIIVAIEIILDMQFKCLNIKIKSNKSKCQKSHNFESQPHVCVSALNDK